MARKISVDLTDENFEALDKFKESRNMPYSIIINRLLRILCKSPDIKDELITICKSRIRALYAEMDQVGTFECQKLYNKSAQYMEILSFLTQNPQITVSSILDEAQMKDTTRRRISDLSRKFYFIKRISCTNLSQCVYC